MTKTKITFTILGVLAVGGVLLISPFVFNGFKSVRQRRALQNRSDYPLIATACVALAQTITNESVLVSVVDSRVPALLRQLSPRYINASSNQVTLEFQGGFDHYGYKVSQSETNPKQWTISYYTEQGDKLLTTISHD